MLTKTLNLMNTKPINLSKIAIKMMLCILVVCTSACAQTEKNNASTAHRTTKKVTEKPSMDIHTAVLSGNMEAVRQHLLAGTPINAKEPISGATPLMMAVTFNKPQIAKIFIYADADLSLTNNDGSTALHIAAFFGRTEIVQLLLDAKADKSIRNNYGATPRETVQANFEDMKPIYMMLIQQLKPMGFTLDLAELQKARPVIAAMLQ